MAKREEAEEDAGEFELPEFDEKAFMRREVEGARVSFWVAGLSVPLGVVSWAIGAFAGTWWYGFLPVLAAGVALPIALKRLGFSADATAWKAMAGNWFLMFFTALSVWVIAVNVG